MQKSHLFCFFLLISFNVFAQDEISYEKEIIKELSSKKFHGRGYSFNGVNKAAKYLASEYKSNGLQSFGKDYYQAFKIDVNTFPRNVKLDIDGKKLIAGKDFIVHPSSPSLKGDFSSYSIPIRDLDNGLKLQQAIKKTKGGFLVIDERASDTISVERSRRIRTIKEALMFSGDIKLSGLIFLTDKNLQMGISSAQALRPALIIRSSSLAYKNITHINLNIKAKFIEGFETKNIIGYIEGKTTPDSFIAITAHYDHLGSLGRKVYFPGANDNASGVAMLMGLSHYFEEYPPDYSMLMMAFSAEEVGILGSGFYVNNPMFDLKKIKFLLNLDLAGTGEEGIKVVNGTVFKQEFSLLKDLNEKNHFLTSVQSRGEACNSDHCKFYLKGVPSFFIYTLGGASNYHDIHDTFENLSLSGFIGYKNLLIDFVEDF